MIMRPQRWMLAALASLVVLAPARAFFAAAPGEGTAGSAAVRRASSLQGLGSTGLTRATARRHGGGGVTRLSMSAETALEQKGLVTVYHKETCPYCKKALALLEDGYSLDVSRIDVLGDDSDKKIKQMKTFSGRDTVPQIFFNSDHIGGNDDLQKLHEEGKLEDMVTKVRAEAPGMMKPNWYHPWY